MTRQWLAGMIIGGCLIPSVHAATSSFEIDPTNTIAGTTAMRIIADGQGVDWTGGVLLINLTSGSIYNAPAFDGAAQQSSFWPLVPGLQWDSAVGIPGDSTASIAGGAGDLGGPGGANQIGLLLTDASPQLVSATWFNTATNNTGPVQVGNITYTNDAVGTWQLILSFAGGVLVQSAGIIEIPEPGTLAVLGFGGLGLLLRGSRTE